MEYVVVGASAAGINALKTLAKLAPNDNLTLISKDEAIHSRCILHHYLEGSRDVSQLNFTDANFIEKNNIRWLKGVSLTAIDTSTQVLTLSDGKKVVYDKVLLATGASTFFPPVKNIKDAANVIGLRNLDDAIFIKEKLPQVENIVVMGAGLVGIDAVEGLLHYGKDLTLVEFGDRLLPIQLDHKASQRYQDAFAAYGVKQRYNTAVQEVLMDETGKVKELALSDGTTIPCDLLIVATGVRSNVQFLEGTPVETDRFGMLFNPLGETNVVNVYGAGDVSGKNPIWPAAVKEGIIAASNMVGQKRVLTDFFASKSTMTFLKIQTMSLGSPIPADDTYQVEIRESPGQYKKIIHKDGIITGAVIQGDLSYSGILTQLVKEQIRIDKLEKCVFDINYSDFFNMTENFEFGFCTD